MDWNNDSNVDLLVGDTGGNISLFLNTSSDAMPQLDAGRIIMASDGTFDSERAAPIVDDWNEDGKKDLIVGRMGGTIEIYLNEGTDALPVFSTLSLLQVDGTDFDIGTRSAPRIYDWNHDGLKDMLIGELYGNIYYLENVGTNAAPVFDSYEMFLLANGDPLKYDYANNPTGAPRSRLFVTDWNEDGLDDIIVGGANGKLELYTSVVPEPVSSTLFILGGAALGFRHFRKKFKQ